MVARRSHLLGTTLKRHKSELKRVKGIYNLQQQMAQVSGELLREVDGWLDLFSEKHLEM